MELLELSWKQFFCSYKLLHIDVTYVEKVGVEKMILGVEAKIRVSFFDDNIRISR